MSDVLAFLRAVAEGPADEATRLVFADWLEERGDWRGEYLRLDCALQRPAAKGEDRAATRARWQELRERLSPSWRAVLERPPIEKCVRFKFECPERWDRLRPTGVAAVRFCDSCRQSVFYCHSIEEAREHAGQGHCVAVDAAVARSPGDLVEDGEMLLGMLVSEED